MTPSGDAVCYLDGCVDYPGVGIIDGPHQNAQLTPSTRELRAPRPEPQQMFVVSICARCYRGACAECCIYGWANTAHTLLANCHCARIRHPPQMAQSGSSTAQYDVNGNVVD
jgi:hypothetical protein